MVPTLQEVFGTTLEQTEVAVKSLLRRCSNKKVKLKIHKKWVVKENL